MKTWGGLPRNASWKNKNKLYQKLTTTMNNSHNEGAQFHDQPQALFRNKVLSREYRLNFFCFP
jgi:hypothetical protein